MTWTVGSHFYAAGRCFSDVVGARSAARAHFICTESRAPHPVELDELVVACPAPEVCTLEINAKELQSA